MTSVSRVVLVLKIGHLLSKVTGDTEWFIGMKERSVDAEFERYQHSSLQLEYSTAGPRGMMQLTKSYLQKRLGPTPLVALQLSSRGKQ